MTSRLLFAAPDPMVDRAGAMMISAQLAAGEARAVGGGRTPWPAAEAVLVHLGRGLLDHGAFDASDFLRRLLTDWAAQAGRPRLALVDKGDVEVDRQTTEWVAGLAPVVLLHHRDRRAAQFDVAQLGRLFNCPPGQGEALEVFSIFLRRALLGEVRSAVLAPMAWAGDARVASVCEGHSLPLGGTRDLVAAVDQARTLVLESISLPIAFQALRDVRATPAAFILTALLTCAFDGGAALGPSPGAGNANLTALFELLARQLLRRRPDARNHSPYKPLHQDK